jgi:hypothetical protein
LVIPLQKGPLAEAVVSFATSPVDRLSTAATASETTFSSGPEIAIGEADEAWKHRWSPLTESTFTIGVSEARVQASPLVESSAMTDPVAEADLEQGLWTNGGVATIRLVARLGPVVNRLLGIVDERLQGTVLSKWVRGPFAVSAFGSAQQSVPTNGPYATKLFSGEIAVSYQATQAVVLDMGVRGLWQRASQPILSTSVPGATDIVEASLVQGIVFVGATLRAPTMRL